MAQTAKFLTEKDWRNLLYEIHKGQVIPVIGPRLVTVTDSSTGEVVTLDRYLAPQLARDLELTDPEQFESLNDVARAFLLGGGERKELCICLGPLLECLQFPPPQALLDLTSITDFNLFLTSTADPLLVNAMTAMRPDFSSRTGVLRFHPAGNVERVSNTHSEHKSPCDLPTNPIGPIVHHILGDYNVHDFAVWEEDYMEYICSLLENRDTLQNLFQLLRKRDLLLLGAPSEDWIVRFFLRIARGTRLSELPQRGYIADRRESLGETMVFFFDKAVKATRIIDGSPSEFVAELAARWREAYGTTNDTDKFLERQSDDMTPGSVFISYSRDDLAMAVRVGQALAAAGVPVWLDKQRLKVGENYERSLEHAIKFEASFFLSLISKNTEANAERFVHRERAWAAQKHTDGFVFYIPLIVDTTQFVQQEPECFAKIDRETLTDSTLPSFVRRMRRLLDELRVSGRPRG